MFIVNFVLDSGLVLRELQQGAATLPRHSLGKKVLISAEDIEQTTCDVPRVFDQYEIDIEMTKHRHSYINSGIM